MKMIFSTLFLTIYAILISSNIDIEKYNAIDYKLFSTKNHPKAKGVNMTMKYPSFWEAFEGDRPNVVQKFIYRDDSTYIQTNIVITSPIKDSRSDKVIADEELTIEKVKSQLPDNYEFLDGGVTTYDNVKGCWMIYKISQSAAGMDASLYSLTQLFIYRKRNIVVTHTINNANLEADYDLFLEYLPVFCMIGSSIILPDQWTTDNMKSKSKLLILFIVCIFVSLIYIIYRKKKKSNNLCH